MAEGVVDSEAVVSRDGPSSQDNDDVASSEKGTIENASKAEDAVVVENDRLDNGADEAEKLRDRINESSYVHLASTGVDTSSKGGECEDYMTSGESHQQEESKETIQIELKKDHSRDGASPPLTSPLHPNDRIPSCPVAPAGSSDEESEDFLKSTPDACQEEKLGEETEKLQICVRGLADSPRDYDNDKGESIHVKINVPKRNEQIDESERIGVDGGESIRQSKRIGVDDGKSSRESERVGVDDGKSIRESERIGVDDGKSIRESERIGVDVEVPIRESAGFCGKNILSRWCYNGGESRDDEIAVALEEEAVDEISTYHVDKKNWDDEKMEGTYNEEVSDRWMSQVDDGGRITKKKDRKGIDVDRLCLATGAGVAAVALGSLAVVGVVGGSALIGSCMIIDGVAGTSLCCSKDK